LFAAKQPTGSGKKTSKARSLSPLEESDEEQHVRQKSHKSSSGASSFRIPKKNPLFETASDEEDLGEDRVLQNKNAVFESSTKGQKFKGVYPDVNQYLKTDKLIPKEMSSLCSDLSNLILHSSADSTWNKHLSAWKLYREFCLSYNVCADWPITMEKVRAFTTWALTVKGLKSSTVKSYISSINIGHEIGNFEHKNFNSDKCIKMALKGASNIVSLSKLPKPTRLAVNVHMLDILGHRISIQDWSPYSKQVIWTACTVCFYSSCRMGELICSNKKFFDKHTVQQ